MTPPIHLTVNPWENGFQDYSEIIDVRSPAEFAEDHLPGAINFPVLNNEERAKVGTIYKQISPFEARKIGAALVSQNIGKHLQAYFLDKSKDYHPLIYCWRGGQRSNSFATVLSQIGWQTTLLQGGYKTYRHYVQEQLTFLAQHLSLKILCGYTGSGKTYLLNAMQAAGLQVLDLEKLANHRGSLLGQNWHHAPTPQPSQKWFESQLVHALNRFNLAQPVWVESESNTIGNIHLPKSFWELMRRSPCYEIEVPIQERVKLLIAEYPHLIAHPDELKRLLSYLTPNHGKQKITEWEALIDAQQWEDFVTQLLIDHYDPAYRRSLPTHFTVPTQTYYLADLSPNSVNQLMAMLQA